MTASILIYIIKAKFDGNRFFEEIGEVLDIRKKLK